VQGSADEENVELFGNSTAEFKPIVQLPDQKTVTGEEEEKVIFAGNDEGDSHDWSPGMTTVYSLLFS
jgi:hypothetical protein